MNDRRTRRYKEKRPLFPFGQLMLPIVGVVALGILILGVRLFFLPPKEPASTAELAAPAVPSVPSLPPEESSPERHQDKQEPVVKPSVVAVPVGDSTGNSDGNGAAAKPTPSEPKPVVAKPAPTKPETPKPASVQPSQSLSTPGSWAVQVGAFTTQKAADALAEQLKAKGESVIVVRADISGKTYFRVRVIAGATRQEADKKAQFLKGQGYPTMVVSL